MNQHTILFYDKCRLCLEKVGVRNIFENDDLPCDITLCTGVQICKSDNLPQKICACCLEIVTNAKNLRIMAKKNNSLLKLLFDGDPDESNKPTTSETTGITVRKDLFISQPKTISSKTTETVSSSQIPSTEGARKDSSESNEHKCDVCSKKFLTPKKLYMHKRLHNKTKSCPLDGCEKMFTTRGDLEKHFRTHTGERPYHCNICGARFTQNSTLRIHKQNLHSD